MTKRERQQLRKALKLLGSDELFYENWDDAMRILFKLAGYTPPVNDLSLTTVPLQDVARGLFRGSQPPKRKK